MYTCGPTVYDYVHIGNWRTFIFEDLLRRSLEFFGWKVFHVMNLTDVDDKTIRGAMAKNISLDAYTKPYKEAFFSELKLLNICQAAHYPEATAFIPEMIEIIEKLIEKGIAYQGKDGSLYYNIRKFPHYGCLSHFKLDELEVGSSERVSVDEYDKEHASDFVLWKSYEADRDGAIFWESPFGKGRPGWHLECSAMAMKLLGETLDIHVGGVDNMFPHHENEIAQSEAYSGKTFAKLWMHAEHLVVDGKKMAKSLGNFYRLNDLLAQGFTPPEIRFMLLQTHYKTQLNFTMTGLEGVRSALHRIQAFIRRLQEIAQQDKKEASYEMNSYLKQALDKFGSFLADDLNISAAIAVLFDLVRHGNMLCDEAKIHSGDAQNVLKLLQRFDTVLAVMDFTESKMGTDLVEQLMHQREAARKERRWQDADLLRGKILEEGYLVEDTPQGPRLIRK
jgi:cysteinyl-tRNA synthetase